MTYHNELHGGVSDLAIKAFTSSYVRYNPLIHIGHSIFRSPLPKVIIEEEKPLHPTTVILLHWTQEISDIFSFRTSIIRGPTVFMACVS